MFDRRVAISLTVLVMGCQAAAPGNPSDSGAFATPTGQGRPTSIVMPKATPLVSAAAPAPNPQPSVTAPTPAATVAAVTSPSATTKALPVGTIAFTLELNNSDEADIGIVSTDGSGFRLLTNASADGHLRTENPSWNPAGGGLFFDVFNGQTGKLMGLDPASGTSADISVGDVGVDQPFVSRDGKRIVFDTPDLNGPSAIYIVDSGGGAAIRLTQPPRGGEGDLGPSISPDGSEITFVRNGAVMVMSEDGSNLHEIVPASTRAWVPRWSPDGDRIVFGNEDGSGVPAGVHIVNPDGSGLLDVTPPQSQSSSPNWSPDGEWICFTYWHPGLHFLVLMAMRSDGTDLTEIWHGDPDVTPTDADWTSRTY